MRSHGSAQVGTVLKIDMVAHHIVTMILIFVAYEVRGGVHVSVAYRYAERIAGSTCMHALGVGHPCICMC